MKIYLTDQEHHFSRHLDFLKQQPVMPYERHRLKEKESIIKIDTTKSFSGLDCGFLFDYRIFPSYIMTYLTQWHLEHRPMKAGDTIVQQAFIPPFRRLSQKIIFGVRIKEIIQEPSRTGFSYETLHGHAEKGISTFTVEEGADQQIVFKVHTYSTPGNLLTRLLGPVFSLPYQAYCTRQALLHVKRQLERS